ncbi:uncharacterized protein [Fopius arisanus]|uniref:Uncharacterized protein n=2 Tax=Fopius arisanus TaxID=64838 RepID=A0A9R1T9U6_9HYME|nr:PREDICTED: uncharacterized protein LOC105267978 [Fopius arisanus]
MVKFVILVGLVLFSEVHGIPNGARSPDDSSGSERARADGWITFSPSWPFSSVSSLFRNSESNENEMKLLKKRIENLEKSQKSIVESLKRIDPGEVNSACNTTESPHGEKPILPLKNEGINNKKKPPVKSMGSLTSSVLTATDHLPGEIDSTIPLVNSRVETTVPVASEKPITSTTQQFGKYNRYSSGNPDNRQIVKVDSIETPPNHNQTSNVFSTESVNFAHEKSTTEVSFSLTSQLGSIVALVSPGSTKLNGPFESPATIEEKN